MTTRAIALVVAALAWSGCASDRSSPVTLAFVGDMMLGRTIERNMRERRDWGFPFQRLGDRLRRADLTFGNLECVVATAGPPTTFRAHPDTLEALLSAGFDVVSVANNHAADGGSDAFAEMVSHLRKRDITPVGVREADDTQPVVVRRAGALRVGFLAYSAWSADRTAPPSGPRVALFDPERVTRDVARARPTVDYLVVALHMGRSAPRSGPEEQRIARATIAAGADLVVGGHPHGPQELERHRGGFIVYSLGDFVFDHPKISVLGALLEVTLAGTRPVRIVSVRTRMNDTFQPEPIGERRWESADLEGPDRALD